jgi:hypothetical protein
VTYIWYNSYGERVVQTRARLYVRRAAVIARDTVHWGSAPLQGVLLGQARRQSSACDLRECGGSLEGEQSS